MEKATDDESSCAALPMSLPVHALLSVGYRLQCARNQFSLLRGLYAVDLRPAAILHLKQRY